MCHWVIIVWLNLTNESFTCPVYELSSEVWSVKFDFAQLSGRPYVAKTTMSTTARWRRNASDEKTKAEIAFEKPKPIVDRIPAKQPKFEKREGEALTSPWSPLANLTTIKLSRKKKSRDFKPKVCVCFKVCFVRFIQSSIPLTSLDPAHKHGPNLDGKIAC